MTRADYIGSIGVFLLLVAFFFNEIGVFEVRGRPYQLLNLIGAGLSCYASWMIGFAPFVVLEGVWGAVAMVALVRDWNG
ncbi:MAG TPA: hypothetical protein VJ728_09980 [Candidatus Binataceae bacterium]|nr:hypothetical protein [Candidatus Binataceae bacterium]